jgi:hypothetical protein
MGLLPPAADTGCGWLWGIPGGGTPLAGCRRGYPATAAAAALWRALGAHPPAPDPAASVGVSGGIGRGSGPSVALGPVPDSIEQGLRNDLSDAQSAPQPEVDPATGVRNEATTGDLIHYQHTGHAEAEGHWRRIASVRMPLAGKLVNDEARHTAVRLVPSPTLLSLPANPVGPRITLDT